MNKLIKNIEAHLISDLYTHLLPKLTELVEPFTEESKDYQPYHDEDKRLYEYYIGAKWGQEVKCTDEDLPHMKKIVSKRLNEEIFGFLIRDMYKLKQALYEYDNNKAREIVDKILDEIR